MGTGADWLSSGSLAAAFGAHASACLHALQLAQIVPDTLDAVHVALAHAVLSAAALVNVVCIFPHGQVLGVQKDAAVLLTVLERIH